MSLRPFAHALVTDRDRIVTAARNLAVARVGTAGEPLAGVFESAFDALLGSLQSDSSEDVVDWADCIAAEIPGADVVQVFRFLGAIVGHEARTRHDGARGVGARLTALEQSVEETIAAAQTGSGKYLWRDRVRSSVGVATLLAAVGARDRATRSHAEATGMWSRRLASALGLADEMVAHVERCGLVHDVGKIAIPEGILNKPGPLDADELALMREHAARGADLVADIPALRSCAPVVRAHHERFDGDGYPDGMSGSRIPLAARIVAVADAFDAMISSRPYRESLPPRVALDILRTGAGSQWDPRIVGQMLALFSGEAAVQRPQVSQAVG